MLKRSKVILAIVLTLAVLAASMVGMFAVSADGPATTASITKVLRMPVNTPAPTASFVFTVTPHALNLNTSAAVVAGMPTVGNVTINTFTTTTNAGVTYLTGTAANIFGGITWPNVEGTVRYSYRVVESATLSSYTGDGDMTFSVAVYYATVVVVDGVVTEVIVYRHTGDTGESDTGKVGPIDGNVTMTFTNNYILDRGTYPPDPIDNAVMSVSKEISGDAASATTAFPFTMTITVADFVAEAGDYFVARIVQNGAIVGNPVTFTLSGTPLTATATFNLTAGQRLSFGSLPVGTGYSVTELATPLYRASVNVQDGGAAFTYTNTYFNANLYVTNRFTGANTNLAAFNNYRSQEPILGLGIGDLPFVGLILIALGGFIAFVVVKSRKRSQSC